MSILLLVIYFLPTIIAAIRSHNNGFSIFLLNLLLGWTVLGWIFALIWSFSNSRPNMIVINNGKSKDD